MKTKRALVICILMAATLTLCATPPPPIEPFEQTFSRFSANYPGMCEQLSREVRSRLTSEAQTDAIETLAALDRYLQNIRGDDIHGIQRVIAGQSKDPLASWCDRLVRDVVGFRRTLDQLIIENMAKSRLRVDGSLLTSLQIFWEEERNFSWRFGIEVRRTFTPEIR
jgi:hypothetical protein